MYGQTAPQFECDIINEYITSIGESRIELKFISEQIQTEREMILKITLLDCIGQLVRRISDELYEDRTNLHNYRDKIQSHLSDQNLSLWRQ